MRGCICALETLRKGYRANGSPDRRERRRQSVVGGRWSISAHAADQGRRTLATTSRRVDGQGNRCCPPGLQVQHEAQQFARMEHSGLIRSITGACVADYQTRGVRLPSGLVRNPRRKACRACKIELAMSALPPLVMET